MTLWMAIGGIVLGAVVSLFVGYQLRARRGALQLQSAEQRARRLLEEAEHRAESAQRAAALEGREEALKLRQQAEREIQESRSTQLAAEQATREREVALGRREIYVSYGSNMGRSRLKIPAAKNGTARNMNTVAKLAELAREMS